jgi:hypothetical protein
MKGGSPAKLKPQVQKEMVGMDLGSTWVRLSYNFKEYLIYNSMFLENNNVYVNKKPNPFCLVDVVALVAQKYQDLEFQKIVKYYNLTFKKGANKNILTSSDNTAFEG